MDRMLYIAMSGANETMAAQAINTNNLANVSTTGFRADFQASMSQQVYGDGLPTRVYAAVEDSGVDFSTGSIISTGRELDAAINGQGWFAVQAPDGSEAYTRAGDFRVDSLGRLTNGAGHIVLGNGGPITIPENTKLEIGGDGTISIQPPGQAANTLAIVDRLKLVNPPQDQLHKGSDGLIRLGSGEAATADAGVSLVSSSLESSNVNSVGAMVRMIELARQYETHIKLMKTAEDIDAASEKILTVT